MARSVRISLASKCQLLFGGAVLLILTAALAVPWLRMESLVVERLEERARGYADDWLTNKIQLGARLVPLERLDEFEDHANQQELTLTLISKEDFGLARLTEPFLENAVELFETRDDRNTLFQPAPKPGAPGPNGVFQFARAVRKTDLPRVHQDLTAGFGSIVETPGLADPIEMILLVRLRSDEAANQLLRNRIYIVIAGLLAGLLAIVIFWFITMRIILSPVRILRDTAEKVSEGDLNIRSEISTGDEFEQLSDTLNHMLASLKTNQDQLRAVNKSLDLKLGELSESNLALYEANKIKSEFLANVSHELRTPLHSIVGFAEVLQETLVQRTGPVDEKRKRYIGNIITSGRRLLELINDLLDLAKIEAGRVELNPTAVSLADTLEGLANLMRPQAEKHNLTVRTRIARDLPTIETDPGKLQQILFNFLSNAVKFSPSGDTVMISAANIPPENDLPMVRISVTDTGPGISAEDQQRIFEKFVQLDGQVTREYGGTGLGLTISRDLARMLGGRIELDSAKDQGATFSLILPAQPRLSAQPAIPRPSPPSPDAPRPASPTDQTAHQPSAQT